MEPTQVTQAAATAVDTGLWGLGTHAGFIIGGYLASFVVIVALIVISVNQARKNRARLTELEARGVRRRSDARATARPASEPKV